VSGVEGLSPENQIHRSAQNDIVILLDVLSSLSQGVTTGEFLLADCAMLSQNRQESSPFVKGDFPPSIKYCVVTGEG
jgi:hypothetical protein